MALKIDALKIKCNCKLQKISFNIDSKKLVTFIGESIEIDFLAGNVCLTIFDLLHKLIELINYINQINDL